MMDAKNIKENHGIDCYKIHNLRGIRANLTWLKLQYLVDSNVTLTLQWCRILMKRV